MWTIVEVHELVWVLLWNGELWGDLYWSLDEAVERVAGWWMGH